VVERPKRPESGNVQAWARDQRYAHAARIALTRGALVAAGHTATDQVETVLYRPRPRRGAARCSGCRSAPGD
jgi:tRNA(Ile)-lysidine synthase